MKHLSKEWKKITEKLKNKHLYLFFDFDGTLTPIEKHPGNVSLSRSMRSILQKLTAIKTVSVAIVSGRRLREIKKMVKVKDITYIGNHGFEAEGPGIKFIMPVALKTKKMMEDLKKKLKSKLRAIKGVIVEDKGLTISVHYRMVRKESMEETEYLFKKITTPLKARKEIVITNGKKVWEIRPPIKWGKGQIVSVLVGKKILCSKEKIVSFYIGDDTTDEDAFLALKNKGYTIKVSRSGNEKSQAKYYLKDVGEVQEFLKNLYVFIKEKGEEKNV